MATPEPQLWRQDSGVELQDHNQKTTIFDLPAEIRTQIWKLVFDPEQSYEHAFQPRRTDGTTQHLHEDYWASDYLEPLLTCRRFCEDAQLLAFSRTTFAVRNPYTALDLAGRMQSRLRFEQIESIRNIAFVAEARHFRQMHNWKGRAFGMPSLQLDELTILLHRSSYWHYLFDFNAIMTQMLRDFEDTKRIKFIRNHALVKPHFHTWFNRFVNAILTVDRLERFGRAPSNPEKTWWNWKYDGPGQTATLAVAPAREIDVSVDEYNVLMAPLLDWLKRSIEEEEYDLDPMSRNGFV